MDFKINKEETKEGRDIRFIDLFADRKDVM
jgi:hypothetical protein